MNATHLVPRRLPLQPQPRHDLSGTPAQPIRIH